MKYPFPLHLLKHKLIKSRLAGLSKDEIEKFFLSHAIPDSIKAIKDFFLSVGIKSVGYKLPKEKITELSRPFVAQFSNPNEFILVDRITDNEFIVTTSEETKRKYSSASFYSRWSGVVLSLDLDRKFFSSTRWAAKEDISNKLDSIIIIFLFIIITFPVFKVVDDFNLSSLGIIALVAISLYSSYTLLRLENGNKSRFEENICYANSKFDCQEVINSKIAHPLSFISFAEIGFFLFSFFCILTLCFSLLAEDIGICVSLIGFSCLLISPLSIFLILYQIFKIKRICPFCTLIQLSIILCSILVFINPLSFSAIFRLEHLYLIALSFLLALCLTIILILYYSRVNLKKEVISYHSLKHSRIVIEALLQQNPRLLFNDTEIVFRSRIGSPEIIFALNPKCKHCYKAFQEYKHLLDTIQNVGFGIIFIVYSDTVKEVSGFVERVEEKYRNNDSSWLGMIDKWYSDARFRGQHTNMRYNEVELEKYKKWSMENNILSSPTIILNNQFWPHELSVIDLSDYLRSYFS